MSANAYVLVKLDPKKTEAIIERLQEIPGSIVREVLGPYDAVVELEADTFEDLTAAVRTKIRPVDGVHETITCTWHPPSGLHAPGAPG